MYGRNCPVGLKVSLSKNEEKLDLLLASGYDVNLGNDYNYTPIWTAAAVGNAAFMKKLLDAKSELLDARLKKKGGPPSKELMHLRTANLDSPNWTVCPNSADWGPSTASIALMLDAKIGLHDLYKRHGVEWFTGLPFFLHDGATQLTGDTSTLEHILDRGYDLTKKMPVGLSSWMAMAALMTSSAIWQFLFTRYGLPKDQFQMWNMPQLMKLCSNKAGLDSWSDFLLMQEAEGKS